MQLTPPPPLPFCCAPGTGYWGTTPVTTSATCFGMCTPGVVSRGFPWPEAHLFGSPWPHNAGMCVCLHLPLQATSAALDRPLPFKILGRNSGLPCLVSYRAFCVSQPRRLFLPRRKQFRHHERMSRSVPALSRLASAASLMQRSARIRRPSLISFRGTQLVAMVA